MWTGEMVASDRVGDMEHRGWASWRAKIPFLSLAHCKKADDLTTSGGFNPEALERGAKALREINNSPYAKRVLEISKSQETTKQEEFRSQAAQFNAQKANAEIEQEKVRWEEQRKTLQLQAQQKAQLAQYEDELARKRMQTEHEAQRQRNGELVGLQEESARRQEALRRQTEEEIQEKIRRTERDRAELEHQKIRLKAIAEAEGRIKEARENRDIRLAELRAQGQVELEKARDTTRAYIDSIGKLFYTLSTDKAALGTAVGGLSLAALGIYGARESTRLGRVLLERYIGKPELVRETSKRGLLSISSLFSQAGKGEGKGVLSDVVLSPHLDNRIKMIATTIVNTRANGAPFRNMLFYGPPGNGKTMIARRLAKLSGLDYAIMSGGTGDVISLGGDAVPRLHSLFDWAKGTRNGLLIFVDEADAFLRRRDSKDMSEYLRSALNAVLYRTGEQSKDFLLVMSTNRPFDLDPAITDRCDDVIEFPLPELEERRRLLILYFDQMISEPASPRSGVLSLRPAGGVKLEKDSSIDDAVFEEAAKLCDGFSAREISKLITTVQALAYGSNERVITANFFKSVVRAKVEEHRFKMEQSQLEN